MDEDQLDEPDHPAKPEVIKPAVNPHLRYEMCGSELHLAWQWSDQTREASP